MKQLLNTITLNNIWSAVNQSNTPRHPWLISRYYRLCTLLYHTRCPAPRVHKHTQLKRRPLWLELHETRIRDHLCTGVSCISSYSRFFS